MRKPALKRHTVGTADCVIKSGPRTVLASDSQPMVLSSCPCCRHEFCTQLAHNACSCAPAFHSRAAHRLAAPLRNPALGTRYPNSVHVISCWGKGGVSIPIHVHAN